MANTGYDEVTTSSTSNSNAYDVYSPLANTDQARGYDGNSYVAYSSKSTEVEEEEETKPFESEAERHKVALEQLQPAREQLVKQLAASGSTGGDSTWFERYLYAMNHSDSEMLTFSREFHHEVTMRARLILEEMNVPIHKKTIRPLSAGGVAGGTKFLHNGILFKFANDPKVGTGHLYGGEEADPERAAKAAANDLKGANAYLTVWQEAKMPMIILPQIVMDFMGFRLIAMPWVEMEGSKIVTGSGDGGISVVDKDEVSRAAFRYAASELHLAFHTVRQVGLYAAGDIEVHEAPDGKRFVLDLARTFPPEDPEVASHLPHVHSSIFFRLHRAKFLQHLKDQNSSRFPPLNSDALSGWGAERGAFHNRNVRSATQYLLTTRARDLVKSLVTRKFPWTRLGPEIQNWGISIRHLGLIRSTCAKITLETAAQPARAHLETQLVLCMVARSGKNLLRQEMREAAISKNVPQVIVTFLNTLVRKNTEQFDAFWRVKLPHDIIDRFGRSALQESEEAKLSSMCASHLPAIVFYICSTCGILLNPSLDMRSIPCDGFEFTLNMIQALSVRSKTLDIFEELLLRDLVEQACKARTASEFFAHVMHLSQKRLASPQLQAALDYINPPFAKIEATDGPDHVRMQCLTLQCLALHFKGYTDVVRQNVYGGLGRLEPEAIALLRALPQIFVDQRQLLSDALVIVCSKQHHENSTPSLVASLIEGQADVNAIDNTTGDSVLHASALRDHPAIVKLLLQSKADLAQKDRYHRTFFSLLHPQDLSLFRAVWAGNSKGTAIGSVSGAGSLVSVPVGKLKPPLTFTFTRMTSNTSVVRLQRSDAARGINSSSFRLRVISLSGQIQKLEGCYLQLGLRRATDTSEKEMKTCFVNLGECPVEEETMSVNFETFFDEWPDGHSLMFYIHQASVPLKKTGLMLLPKKPASNHLVARLSTGRPIGSFEVIHTVMACKESQNSGLSIFVDIREVIFNP